MNKPESKYLNWLKSMEFPEISLASSGMHSDLSAADLGISADELKLGDFALFGQPDLKTIIGQKFNVPGQNIFLNTGATGCNFALFAVLFDTDDSVLVETPVYDTIPAAIEQVGAQVQFLPRHFENDYKIDPGELEQLIKPRTRGVVLTNLHNPSGVLLNDEEIIAISEICAAHDCWLVIDEIYLEFFFENRPQTAFHLNDNIIITSSLTKAYGVGGLRAGWAFAPEVVVQQAYDAYTFIGGVSPYLTEYIAAKMIGNPEIVRRTAEKPMQFIETNLAVLDDFMNATPELEWIKPDGGISCFPRMESEKLVEYLYKILIEEYDTLIIPGKYFFEPRHFRLSYGMGTDILQKGLNNIRNALSRL